jgi:hypothetical protein
MMKVTGAVLRVDVDFGLRGFSAGAVASGRYEHYPHGENIIVKIAASFSKERWDSVQKVFMAAQLGGLMTFSAEETELPKVVRKKDQPITELETW